MGYLIDISNPLHEKLPVWPESNGVNLSRTMDQEKGDMATVSYLQIGVHSGTHIDAPLHFIPGGKTTEEIPLSKLTGHCRVLDLRGHKTITPELLDQQNIPADTRKLLFRTDNSEYWKDLSHDFRKDFCALTKEAAQWIVDHNIHLVGIDYHSIQLFEDPFTTHEILLKNEVVIVETLNLADVNPGPYQLWCLPVRIRGVEGAPARVLLETI